MKLRRRSLRDGLAALFLVGLASGCVPTFTDPPPADPRPDPALLGTWQSPGSESDAAQVAFFPRQDGHIDIVHLTEIDGRSEKGPSAAFYVGYTATVGEDRLLCFRGRDAHAKTDESSPYLLARYRLQTPSQLEVQLFATDAVRGLIEDGRLQGTIQEQERMPAAIAVTSTAPALVELIGSAGVDAFVSSDNVMRFERLVATEATEP